MTERKKFTSFQKIVLLVLLLSVIGLWFWGWRWPSAVVGLKGQELNVLLAKTPKHHYRGLGKRDSLGEFDGMLFVFPLSRKLGIVMRDMRFPIDIIWLERGEVVDIAPSVQLEPDKGNLELKVYKPRVPANLVLELPAGWAAKHQLKIGDRLQVLEE